MISHSIAPVFDFIQSFFIFLNFLKKKKFLYFWTSWYIMKQKYTKKDGRIYGVIRTVAFHGLFGKGR